MKKIALTLIATAVGLAGCANMQETTGMDNKTAGAVGGGLIGCAGGAFLARMMGGDAAAGCAAGAVVGGLIGYENARKEEIASAERAKQEALDAMATMPAGKKATGGEVKTVEVAVTDKAKGETKKLQAFDSVSLDFPISTKGTPEHTAAMGKLKTLAERVADQRGSSEIFVSVSPTDPRNQKVALQSDQVKTQKGNLITVTRMTDAGVPKGVERITVKAGSLKQTEV